MVHDLQFVVRIVGCWSRSYRGGGGRRGGKVAVVFCVCKGGMGACRNLSIPTEIFFHRFYVVPSSFIY